MKKEERLKLEELSLKAFGSRSKYRRVMEKGELISQMSTDSKGRQVKVRAYERPDETQIVDIMNDLIKEKETIAKEEAELKAQEENKSV